MKTQPKVSIIIVNYKDPKDTLELLSSLKGLQYKNVEVIIVDNGTEVDRTDLYKAIIDKARVFCLIENRGFAGGVNYGIKKSTGEFTLLINNDTVVSPDLIQSLLEAFMCDPEIGMVSPKIKFYNQPSIIQYAGATQISSWFGRGKKFGFGEIDLGQFNIIKETGLCNGACLMIRKQVFEDVGLLPEFYFMYYEEHDFCLRAKRFGWKTYYAGNTTVLHKQSMSIGKSNPLKQYYQDRNRLLFMRRFSKPIELCFFSIYIVFFQLPYKILAYVLKGKFTELRYYFKALIWNLKNTKTGLA